MGKRLIEILDIEHPIVQAPMNWVTNAELVAAVCNAGGLGTLGPNAGARVATSSVEETAERLRQEISKVRQRTNKPFAVNFPLGDERAKVFTDRCIEIGIEEKLPVAIISSGSPDVYTTKLKNAGMKVIHVISNVKQARKAEQAGVDAVVCQGFEAGGHGGRDQIPTFVLIPQVVDAVSIPVLAAGGISDGRTFAAALILGAQGIYMGTAFLATVECAVHDRVKGAIVGAKDNDTLYWGKKTSYCRTLRNEFTKQYMQMEEAGAIKEELEQFIKSYDVENSRRYGGLLLGDLLEGEVYIGAGSGLIKEVKSAASLIQSIVEEAREILSRRNIL